MIAAPKQSGAGSVVVEDQRHIVEAINAGDVARARTLMLAHVRGIIDACHAQNSSLFDRPIKWG